jgi:hypothetical protein
MGPNGHVALRARRTVAIVTLGLACLAPAQLTRAATSPSWHPTVGSFTQQHRAANHAHRRHNIAPKPDYFNVCATRGHNNPKCIKESLAAIRHARKAEHMKHPAMILPRNYRSLTVAEQTFVVTNLERVDRGRRPFRGLTAPLSHLSHVAAVARVDPSVPVGRLQAMGISRTGSVWANDLGPISSDYNWMYNDGYSKNNGINIACVTPKDWGCWAHRGYILSRYQHLPALTAGAGTGKPAGASIVELFAAGRGRIPAFTYTWKRALAHGANGHH